MGVDAAGLLRRIAKRDDAALAVLYAEFGAPVYSLARRVLQHDVLAQEVTQDTFLKVWNNPLAWEASKGQFSSWLLTLARNTAVDRLRREMRRTGKDVALFDEIESGADDDPPPDLTPEEMQAMLHVLPPEQRQLIELAFYRGMTHSELAAVLGLPLGTVKTRMRLGLQKLRNLLSDAS
ncbi:MAG: sigma-70 family RNA polymerase sigma factor [Anaerolineae bacterium]|nr:sigma-70 family RNA polymerase sigma factor [Anaerolineae bacterium]